MTEPKTTIENPFLRQVEIVIGPLPEYKGGGPESQGIKLYGDGTPDNFRIKFQVNKPWLSSNATVYNLGPSLRNALHTQKAQMVIRAGWQNFGMIDIFKGSLLASFNTRQGADIVTELIGYSGWYSKAMAIKPVQFASGVAVSEMVRVLASTLEGIIVDEKNIDIEKCFTGSRGKSFPGLVSESLDELSRTYGFTWWVDMTVFHALSHDKHLFDPNPPVISGKNGYLMRAEPVLSSPIPARTGVHVSSLFQPFVNFKSKFILDSAINLDLNGDYVAHTVSHTGDTHSNQWNTELQSFVMVETFPTAVTQYTEWTDVELLAGTIYGEAGGESRNGKIAVGMTVQTRVQHPRSVWGGSSWKSVMLAHSQFDCWRVNSTGITNARRANGSTWKECMGIAQEIRTGKVFDVGLTNAPTNYFAGRHPAWSKGMQFIGTIGGHYFYHDTAIG